MTTPLTYDKQKFQAVSQAKAAELIAQKSFIASDRAQLPVAVKDVLGLRCDVLDSVDNADFRTTAKVRLTINRTQITIACEMGATGSGDAPAGVAPIADVYHIGLTLATRQANGTYAEIAGADYGGFKKEAGTPPGGSGADITIDPATSLVTRTNGAAGTETAPLSDLLAVIHGVLADGLIKDSKHYSKTASIAISF